VLFYYTTGEIFIGGEDNQGKIKLIYMIKDMEKRETEFPPSRE
jgi:hypothetical protein